MTEATFTSFHTAKTWTTRFAELAKLFRTWQKRSRGRRDLARMSNHELSDIGISQADRYFETAKPFWKS